MQKAKQYNIADSNIANLGSDLEKKVRLDAAETEAAWKGAGKEVGTLIWRIEQFKVVPVAKEAYGSFYSGDSYIVLHTYKAKADSTKLLHDVHFWLGTYTTQDEAGTAAYKTVELDDYLHGLPVQYREVQGYESSRFLSYFPKGIRLLEGGKESGFKHVEAGSYRTRLLQVKGKKHIRVHEVPLSHQSLNLGDVFIVDAAKDLIQWNGPKSGPMEKAKAAQVVQAIEGEREGRVSGRVVEEEGDEPFWKLIGGKGPVADAAAGGSDIEHEKKHTASLHRLSDASGSLTFTEVAKGDKFKHAQLDSSDVFILDTGAQIFAWVGKGSSVGEKKKALSFAQQYVQNHNLPVHTSIARILEGGENEIFESYFN